MNVKKTVKKIVALGAGAGLVGATLMGAMAQDLSQFPANMMAGGQFDGKIVLGADAKTEDLIGAVDIAAGLQAASTSDVAVGDSVTSIGVEGDAAQLGDSGDLLEIGEYVGEVTSTLTDEDLDLLADGRIQIQGSSTDYSQTIDFLPASQMEVLFEENENNDDTGVFFHIEEGEEILSYELDFASGLDSDIDSNDMLEDLEDEEIVFMGQEYSVVRAEGLADDSIRLELIAGDITDTLQVGDTKTYTVDGVDYEVTVVIIGNDGNVKFLVNNEATSSLSAGETETLDSGLEIGVREVVSTTQYLESQPGSVVEFYLGANKVVLTDTDMATNDGAGTVEVDDDELDNVEFDIQGSLDLTANDATINRITYKVFAEAADRGVWVAEDSVVSEQLENSDVFLNPNLDIYFAGLTSPNTEDVAFTASGDEEYQFEFVNNRGTDFNVPFLYVDGDTVGFGEDATDAFLFWEEIAMDAAAATIDEAATAWVDLDDYVLLTEDDDDVDSVSYILQLDKIDDDADAEELTFTEVGSGDEIIADYDDTATYVVDTFAKTDLDTPSGEIRVGGDEFNFWLVDQDAGAATDWAVLIDMNGDGDIAGVTSATADGGSGIEVINAVIRGGGMVKLATEAQTTPAAVATVTPTITTLAAEMDETADGDDVITITIAEQDADDELDLTGVAASGASGANIKAIETANDEYAMLTRYGAFAEWSEETGADDVTIAYPSEQVEALVYVLGGDYERSESVSGTSAQRVNILDVGLAVLDTEVSLDQTNLIVVGGPCVNTVAAELLEVVGNADCAEGFQPGEGMVRLFNTGDNIAMLVAGYSAQDTVQTAAKVHEAATGTVENFEGDSVVVTIAGQNDVTVRAATPAPAADEDME